MTHLLRLHFSLLIVMFYSVTTSAQESVQAALFELADVIFTPIEAPEGYSSAYELRIKQPVDHSDASKGYFYQRAYLSHRDVYQPTVMITHGYGQPYNRVEEISELLQANQISIEHRYFLESCPDSMDYDYLNFAQITADLHKINQLFRQIYQGKWLASGISKGGTTSIFYRYFYPEDVDVTIPYVAPVNHSKADQRLYDFLNEIGTAGCRNKIKAFQRDMLANAADAKALLKWYYLGKDLKFNYLSFDEAYEYAVLEYSFSFWQYGHDCGLIPDSSDDLETKLQHFIDLVGLDLFSDRDMEAYASHYYQSGTEMGYYGYELQDFADLLQHIPTDQNASAVFMPGKMAKEFKPDLTNQVAAWAQRADHMIYINGALDTWSATAVPANDQTNSLYFFLEDKHHGTARIGNMSPAELELLHSKLTEWLQLD